MVVEKAILVRCLKHVLRDKMKNAKATYLPYHISHFLNCVFNTSKNIDQLNTGKIKFEQDKSESLGKKKNKKNK